MSTKFLMRSFLLLGILLVPFTCVLSQEPEVSVKPAISPEKRGLIAELLEATETRKTALAVFNSILDQDEKEMPGFIWQGLLNTKGVQELGDDAKEDLRKKLLAESTRTNTRVRELFTKRIDFARLVEDLSTDLYDKYFTEPELKDLIVFYKSPTGKKAIEVMPKMFAESMSNTMEAIKPKMLEIMTELVNEEAERVRKDLEAKKSQEPAKAQRPGRRRQP